MRKRSLANKAASSPPVPALTSRITFFLSNGSFGIINSFKTFSAANNFSLTLLISDLAISIKSASLPLITLFSSSNSDC